MAEHLETCDRLLSRIDEVDGELDGMLSGWRSVEDGGKSLKGACEQLLEERVSIRILVHQLLASNFTTYRINCYRRQKLLASDWNISKNWNTQPECLTIPGSL